MNYSDLSDSPLESPKDDLLEVNRYPRELAKLILDSSGPLTVGIYGAWGVGKTSFVRLVEGHLRGPYLKPFKFITFSAWPFRTADELWRAMILQIAQAVYDVKPDEPAAREAPPGLLDQIGRFLAGDAVVLDGPEPEPPPTARGEYDGVVSRLEGIPYGTIAKDGGQRLQLDQQEATMAVVKAALAGLGSLSPLIAGLRGLLGLGGEISLASLIRREKNEAVRERIASAKDFKTVFKELVDRAEPTRLCVCVDDLDRCMPDVALDLLEAIKIFLGDSSCVFLVAADQELISRGLRHRYREFSGPASPAEAGWDLDRKGQEYFEKIIQLRIPVPTPTEAQLRDFIAVQFPRWAPVSDIILTDVGHNPRRIKQHCHWLTYKQSAFETP